jgi:ferredoxin-NADP reductase
MSLKLRCAVERISRHGDHVYTLTLRPERQAPRFRAGQFLHLALDEYDRSGFWPESRVFSIASSPDDRETVRITYAVHGRFTERMERELVEGKTLWIKLPYGDFFIEGTTDVVLFAGGTGITAFTAFLESATPPPGASLTLAYGARSSALLIYRQTIERCRQRLQNLQVLYFVENLDSEEQVSVPVPALPGRVSVDNVWPRLKRPNDASFYISGPPSMLRGIADDLKTRGVGSEAIFIDAWE